MADLTVITYRQTRAIKERQAYSNPPPDSEPEQMSVHKSLQRSGHQRSKREPEQPETSSHKQWFEAMWFQFVKRRPARAPRPLIRASSAEVVKPKIYIQLPAEHSVN
jgi:hypothetical protein